MIKIAVIGIGGVGMAHVCAAGRLGLNIAGMFDINQGFLSKAKKRWVNEWEGLVEEVEVQDNTLYGGNVKDLPKLGLTKNDIVIIATPPQTHINLLEEVLSLTPSKILVEKPISNNVTNFNNDRLWLSMEWVYHSQLPYVIGNELKMVFPCSKITNWESNIVLDFGPHLLSIITYLGYVVQSMELEYKSDNKFSINIKTTSNSFSMNGSRIEANQGLFIDNQVFSWEDDLFDKQLMGIIRNERIVPWGIMQKLENNLKTLIY